MSARGPELVIAAAKRANRAKTDARIPPDTAITPALTALLAYDRDWVPAFKRKPKRLGTSEVVARALKKLKITGSDVSNFDTLYPGSCIELTKPEVDEGNVEVTFLYIGDKRDAADEYPVLTYFQPEDGPGEIVIIAPGIDVWLARREGLVEGPAGAPSFGLPQEYAAALQAQADLNFAGCWAHEFSDVVEAHGDTDCCRPLTATKKNRVGRDLIILGERAWYLKLEDVLSTFHADAYKNWIGSDQETGRVYVTATVPERVEQGELHRISPVRLVPPGAPGDDPRGFWLLAMPDNGSRNEQLAIRLERTPQTDNELFASVLRALASRPGFWVEVGKYKWHQWSVTDAQRLTRDELEAWLARYG